MELTEASGSDKGVAGWLNPLNLADFTSSNCALRERFVRELGHAFVTQGFVFLTGHGLAPEFISTYYKTAARVLCEIPEARLRAFEFVKESIDRGYVSSPSGAPKPTVVCLRKTPQVLVAAGLKFIFDNHAAQATVTVSAAGEKASYTLPSAVYDPGDSSTEVVAEHGGRSLRFRRLDFDGTYAVFAPDDKHGWITGVDHNAFPSEAADFALMSLELCRAHTAAGILMIRALGRFLNDHNDMLPRLVANDAGKSIAAHALRTYRYPAISKDELESIPDDAHFVRVGEHRDISLLTVLPKANLPGLQIQMRDQTWVDVRAPHDSVVVMTGEMLSHITRGLRSETGESMEIYAPLHRVMGDRTNIHKDRYTAPFFFNADLRQPILNLNNREPVTIRNVRLEPGLRLLHSHMLASTQFSRWSFEDFAADYDQLGRRLQKALAMRGEIQARYIQ